MYVDTKRFPNKTKEFGQNITNKFNKLYKGSKIEKNYGPKIENFQKKLQEITTIMSYPLQKYEETLQKHEERF